MLLKGIYYWGQLARYLIMERLNQLFRQILDPRLGQIHDYSVLYFIALRRGSSKA